MEIFSTQDLYAPWINSPPSSCTGGSPLAFLMRGSPNGMMREITLNGNNNAFSVNIAKIQGGVDIIEFSLFVSEAITNCTGAYLDVYNGTNSYPITEAVTGATLTGAGVLSKILLPADETAALTLIAAATGGFDYQDSNILSKPLTVVQKGGTNTYIRFNAITSDTPMTGKINVIFRFRGNNNSNLNQP